MKSLFKDKKANAVIDTATFLIVFFIMALITIISYHAFKEIYPQISPEFNNSNYTAANTTLTTINESYPSTFDGGIVFIFFGIWIAVLIASYQIDTHPVFFVVSMIMLIAICVAAIFISNFYEEMFADAVFNNITSSFPMTNWIATHMLIVVIVIGASITMVLYAKMR